MVFRLLDASEIQSQTHNMWCRSLYSQLSFVSNLYKAVYAVGIRVGTESGVVCEQWHGEKGSLHYRISHELGKLKRILI